MREQVKWFAEKMESRLAENDHKTGWEDCEREFLLQRLESNFHDLWAGLQAHGSFFDAERVIRKATNIANFSMMVADQARKTMNTD
ncbi:hypothetical protein HQN89_10720 [Paenibacillus frigoriresistens]|uniref:hypothetical protein n=1 Tax=Paenibacillus alginolyticus TaxID=59839 RepID=UPI0015669D1E|nr:hypothetical protein [Paenibacillus frigoriresistens]NRF91492.1 hypothetical protein [Paenibacillus frigoriresistens]